MSNIGRIEIVLPFCKSLGGIHFFVKRHAALSFTNSAILICSRNLGMGINDVMKWADKNRNIFMAEMLWAAYLANCQENYQKPVFDKARFLQGYSKLPDSDQKRIIECWNESKEFGTQPIQGAKKKAK